MSVDWLREVEDKIEFDDTHALLDRATYESLGAYESIGQPTNPSVGRIFRTHNAAYRQTGQTGWVVVVEEDPTPGYVLRRGRIALVIDPAAVPEGDKPQ